MLHEFFNNLSSPFPYTRGLITESFSTLRTCVLATIILFLIKPFGLNDTTPTIILGFGIVVLISALLNILITLFILRKFVNEEKWTVWKEVIRTLIYLSLNVVAIMLFANYSLPITLDKTIILKFIGFTIIFAIIPISIRTISVKNWLLKKRLDEAQDLANIIEEKTSSSSHLNSIVLKSNIVNDAYTTNSNELLFIEAEKNYITIVDNKKGKINKTLLRLSLTKAQEQINNEAIIRCHRSFLININAVSKVIGNSQGLKLVFLEGLQSVPISRSYKKAVIKKINEFHSSYI